MRGSLQDFIIFLPKQCGDLGIWSLRVMNKAPTTKVMWRTLKSREALWGKIWLATPGIVEQDLIMVEDIIVGSYIWNNARKHLYLVQKHSLWEIGWGTSTLFWEDSRQQLLLFHRREATFLSIKGSDDNQNWIQGMEFWKHGEEPRTSWDRLI
jgi:hypothetical protein